MRAPVNESVFELKIMKKLFDFFKKPPLWFLLVLAVIGIGAIVGGTLFLTQDNLYPYVMWGYVFLGVMCVTVGYCIYGFIKILPDLNERVLKWSENKPFWNRTFTEYGFRTILFSIGSFVINLAFAVYNGSIAIVINSVWFGALAAYYVLLIVLRGTILVYHAFRRKAVKAGQTEDITLRKDTRIYGVCGIVLLLLPIALSFAILQMVRANDSFVHTGITIYAYAIYAFYKIIVSVYNFVKTRHTNEMTVRAAKNINLADAFVSILALQTAMFREFDAAGDAVNVATMNAVTGAIVCALTAAIGVFMIVIAIKKTRKERNKNLQK